MAGNLLLSLRRDRTLVGVDQDVLALGLKGLVEVALAVQLSVGGHGCGVFGVRYLKMCVCTAGVKLGVERGTREQIYNLPSPTSKPLARPVDPSRRGRSHGGEARYNGEWSRIKMFHDSSQHACAEKPWREHLQQPGEPACHSALVPCRSLSTVRHTRASS